MSTPILICAGIAVVLLIFVLSNIAPHLYDIHIDLCHIHDDLARFYLRENKPTKTVKQRRSKNVKDRFKTRLEQDQF